MSPAVSKAQYAKMIALYEEGKITKEQLERFIKGVNYTKLPARKRKKRPQKQRRR